MQDGLTAVNDVATVKFGIGGLKYACEVLGYLPLQKEEERRGEERRGEERRGDLNEERYHGGEPRVPIPKATEGQRKEIKEVLDQFQRNQQK